jgi:hypothetical protein
MVGLAHAIGADSSHATLSRECLWSVIRRYPGYAEQMATAREQVSSRQAEFEQAVGLVEAPPLRTDLPCRPVAASRTGPSKLDHLRRTRHAELTSCARISCTSNR